MGRSGSGLTFGPTRASLAVRPVLSALPGDEATVAVWLKPGALVKTAHIFGTGPGNRESHRLAILVENVLSYARLEDGRAVSRKERITTRRFLDRIVPLS